MPSIRDRVITADDIRSEIVHVPEWDVKIEVRGMTVAQRIDYAQRASAGDRIHLYSELLIATCFDPDSGDKVFDRADRDVLATKASRPVQRLAEVANRLSGLTEESEKEAESELGKGAVSEGSS